MAATNVCRWKSISSRLVGFACLSRADKCTTHASPRLSVEKIRGRIRIYVTCSSSSSPPLRPTILTTQNYLSHSILQQVPWMNVCTTVVAVEGEVYIVPSNPVEIKPSLLLSAYNVRSRILAKTNLS